MASKPVAQAKVSKGKVRQPISDVQVVDWFRNANPRLANLPVSAVQTLAAMLRLHASGSIPYIDHPHFDAGYAAFVEALKAAQQLRGAITRLQRHLSAMKEAEPSLDAVLAALDAAELLRDRQRGPGRRSGSLWMLPVIFLHKQVEEIIEAHGFKRASTSSAGGPAAKVLSALLHDCYGGKIDAPGTIAREWGRHRRE